LATTFTRNICALGQEENFGSTQSATPLPLSPFNTPSSNTTTLFTTLNITVASVIATAIAKTTAATAREKYYSNSSNIKRPQQQKK
jgi:hypothetical protein